VRGARGSTGAASSFTGELGAGQKSGCCSCGARPVRWRLLSALPTLATAAAGATSMQKGDGRAAAADARLAPGEALLSEGQRPLLMLAPELGVPGPLLCARNWKASKRWGSGANNTTLEGLPASLIGVLPWLIGVPTAAGHRVDGAGTGPNTHMGAVLDWPSCLTGAGGHVSRRQAVVGTSLGVWTELLLWLMGVPAGEGHASWGVTGPNDNEATLDGVLSEPNGCRSSLRAGARGHTRFLHVVDAASHGVHSTIGDGELIRSGKCTRRPLSRASSGSIGRCGHEGCGCTTSRTAAPSADVATPAPDVDITAEHC